mmetsp:Transcript_50647/g.114929  ORF Transcript_50647/g.114929 Transcript_50647/m.114929 type:complete len:91 (-) Transcript_50647:249-521(-)
MLFGFLPLWNLWLFRRDLKQFMAWHVELKRLNGLLDVLLLEECSEASSEYGKTDGVIGGDGTVRVYNSRRHGLLRKAGVHLDDFVHEGVT